MPRIPRQKTFDSTFHVMCRSMKEVGLFKDDQDKAAYMGYVKKYQKQYQFKVYSYCLMDTHCHFIIDANGSDISKVMHDINFSYAQYYNIRHDRIGHVFYDRFKSKIIKDDRYLFAASAYIHNNPIDIKMYETNPEKHPFSSLSVYLGLKNDPYEILDEGFILNMFGNNIKIARENYRKLVFKSSDKIFKDEIEFENEGTQYKSCKRLLVRDIAPFQVIDYITMKMGVSRAKLITKNNKNAMEARCMLVLIMRSVCDFKCSDICAALGNITQVGVSKLSKIGKELLERGQSYEKIVEDFVECYGTG